VEPLGMAITAVGAGTPLLAWPLVGRTWRTGVAVEVLIAAYLVFVVAVGLGAIHTRARMEVLISYAPATATLIWLGWIVERRRLGPGRTSRRVSTGAVLTGLHVAVAINCCIPSAFLASSDPFVPRSNEVLPLPTGMVVVSDDDTDCGSGMCTRTVTITSRDQRPADLLYQQVVTHLHREHGWHLATHGAGCRPAGWLLDRTTLCVAVRTVGVHTVVIDLTGERAFVF
jgi:hypothetical protein